MARGRGTPGAYQEAGPKVSVVLAALLALSLGAAHGALDYIVARREETVDAICLGRDPQFAFAWDPSSDTGALPAPDYAQISWAGTGAVSNANFMYIGAYSTLTEHLCASKMESWLYNTGVSGHFIDLEGAPLPGSAGNLAYVTPIWKALPGLKVSLTIVNKANETWQIVSTQPEDPVIPADSAAEAQVPGSFFNSTLDSMDMVQEFLTNAAVDGDRYPLAVTQGAMIMDEEDGTTAYVFFGVFAGDSELCTEPGQKPNASLASVACVLAHVFEAQYEVSDIVFQEINEFYIGYSRRRRRLLAVNPKDGYMAYLKQQEAKRRVLASTTTISASRSSPGAVQAVTCRLVANKFPWCRRGNRAYPRCAFVCTANSNSGKS